MRVVASTDVAAKAELLVETGRRCIVRAQADVVESAVGGLHDAFHQLPAHAHAAERGQDVQVPEPSDALIACIGVNIEPADSDESSIDEGAEQDFSRPVEPIRTRGPLVGQPADQAQSKPFTFRDELADRRRREIVQRFDRDESDVAHSPLRSCPIMIR